MLGVGMPRVKSLQGKPVGANKSTYIHPRLSICPGFATWQGGRREKQAGCGTSLRAARIFRKRLAPSLFAHCSLLHYTPGLKVLFNQDRQASAADKKRTPARANIPTNLRAWRI